MNQYIYYMFDRELDLRHRELAARADETRLARAMVLEGRARQHRKARRFRRPSLRLLRGVARTDVAAH